MRIAASNYRCDPDSRGRDGRHNEAVYSMFRRYSGSNFRIDSCQYVYNLNSGALGIGHLYRVDHQDQRSSCRQRYFPAQISLLLLPPQQQLAISRHASPRGGFLFHRGYGSFEIPPACLCVSITLPAAS